MAQQKQKSNKNGNGNAKGDNGQGKTKPIEDSETQDARRRAKKAAQKVVARGMHRETMTSGLAADELKRRQAVATVAIKQLKADASRLEKSVKTSAPDRVRFVRGQLNVTIDAIAIVEKFLADPLMRLKDRAYAFRSTRDSKFPKASVIACKVLTEVDNDLPSTLL